MTGADVLAMPEQAPGDLQTLADRCERAAATADGLAAVLHRDRHRLAAAWDGRAASSCDTELVAVAALVERVVVPLRAAGRLLQAHAAELHRARLAVVALRQEYDDLLLTHRAVLAAASSVAGLPPGVLRLPATGGDAELAAELASVRARHRAVLDRLSADAASTAARIDAAVAAARPPHRAAGSGGPMLLGGEAALAALLPLLAAARAVSRPGSPPPEGTPPRRVGAWWRSLTTDEQRRLSARSAAVGTLAGVPLPVRAAANERRLTRDIAQLSAQRPGAGRPPWLLGTCLAVADALALARAVRDPVTGRRLAASLLVYRPAAFGGRGRVAVAVGDLQRADNVAVLVPGLGSTVGGTLRDLTATAGRVTGLARRHSPGEVTATVAWTAYDAPDLLQVAGDAAALGGARLLTSDLGGLRAGAAGAPAHVTLVGHSYGSTTVGTAVRTPGTGVDDVVLLGSPGANAERASELRVPAGHVWAGAASRDPVSYLDRFGADPSQAPFGATRFRAEDVARHPVMLSLGDHSRYFAPGSESLDNVVRVVVGDVDEVGVATYRRETPWLPDGIAADPEADRRPASARGW